MNRFKPLPAQSAGLITNYRCTFRCAHSLYCAAPGLDILIQKGLKGLYDHGLKAGYSPRE